MYLLHGRVGGPPHECRAIAPIWRCHPAVAGTSPLSVGWPLYLRGWVFRVAAASGHLLFVPPTSPALSDTMTAPCSLLDSMLVGRAALAGFERSQVRGTLWREGLYYSQSGGVMFRGHQIQRQGQSSNELEPSPTWQGSP